MPDYLFTEDTERPLPRNPGMGWMIYIDQDESTVTEGNPGRYLDAGLFWREMEAPAAKAGILYLRLPWTELEPAEGQYAWEHNANYRAIISGALRRGLKLAFRVNVDSTDYQIQATPQWVRDAGARGRMTDPEPGALGGREPRWNPYLEDAVFRAKLEQFIAAFAREYDDPNRVTFIDGEGLGRWGEMHTFNFETGDYVENGRNALRWVVGIYSKNFKRVLLCHSFQNWALGKDIDDEVLAGGYLLRRDGLTSSRWFKQEEKDRMKSYWPRVPVFAENCYWNTVAKADWFQSEYATRHLLLEALLRDAEEIHANTLDLRIIPDAQAYLAECPDLVDRFLIEGGYRFVPGTVSYPRSINAGAGRGGITIAHTWKNTGWGRLPGDLPAWKGKYAVAFALLDPATSEPAAILLSSAEPSAWLRGAKAEYKETLSVVDVLPGTYRLATAIVDTAAHNAPAIELALKDPRNSSGWYPVGAVDVVN